MPPSRDLYRDEPRGLLSSSLVAFLAKPPWPWHWEGERDDGIQHEILTFLVMTVTLGTVASANA
jgi:hypothetical protein